MPLTVAVIPARFASVRLPGKALADIGGLPMVVRVLRRVLVARRVDRAVVATDDERIAETVRAHRGEVVLTGAHPSGSDRVAEAARLLALPEHAVIVNVQGDEPLVDPLSIDALVGALDDPEVDVATVAAPMAEVDPHARVDDPSRVKVVTDAAGRALYFSRCPIPHGGPWRIHLGMYAYRLSALARFTAQGPAPIEQSERLEQLRFLWAGLTVRVVDVTTASPSVDTPADLAYVRRLFEA